MGTVGAVLGSQFLGLVVRPAARAEPAPAKKNLIRIITDQERPPMWFPPGWDDWNLPSCCRACDVLPACNGECPKNRFLRTPDGEAGLNWDPAAGRVAAQFTASTGVLSSVAIHPAGTRLAMPSTNGPGIQVWDVDTRHRVGPVLAQGPDMKLVGFTHDWTRLIAELATRDPSDEYVRWARWLTTPPADSP